MHCSEILSSVKLLTMYRRFGTTYRFHLKGSRRRILDPCRRDRQVVPKLRHRVTTLRCLISQSNADRVRIAAKSLKRLVVKYLYTFRIYKEIVKLHCWRTSLFLYANLKRFGRTGVLTIPEPSAWGCFRVHCSHLIGISLLFIFVSCFMNLLIFTDDLFNQVSLFSQMLVWLTNRVMASLFHFAGKK